MTAAVSPTRTAVESAFRAHGLARVVEAHKALAIYGVTRAIPGTRGYAARQRYEAAVARYRLICRMTPAAAMEVLS